MFIEQSGRFVRMTFEKGLQLDAKLHFEPRPQQQGVTLRFRSPDWELTAEGRLRAGILGFDVAAQLLPPSADTSTWRMRPCPDQARPAIS